MPRWMASVLPLCLTWLNCRAWVSRESWAKELCRAPFQLVMAELRMVPSVPARDEDEKAADVAVVPDGLAPLIAPLLLEVLPRLQRDGKTSGRPVCNRSRDRRAWSVQHDAIDFAGVPCHVAIPKTASHPTPFSAARYANGVASRSPGSRSAPWEGNAKARSILKGSNQPYPPC